MAEELPISRLFQPSNQARAALGPVRTIGIDLGTTTSVVAEAKWDPSLPDRAIVRCLEVAQPTERDGVFVDVLAPSAVAVLGERKLVGEGARRVAATGPAGGLHQDRGFFLETKNFIGTRRVYGGAPEGFRTPVEIAGHILEFLADAMDTADPSRVDRRVVTVPASFNPAQRRDTRRAAELAGISLGPGDLLDEPLAAFLDFASQYELPMSARSQRLAVFDWGGGTCDVAMFQVQSDGAGGPIGVAPLAVSRYHRLGGGDVDAAIVYEVLLSQLVTQNGLGPFELTYLDKKRFAEPALRPIAEALKIGLAREVARLRGLGRLSSVAPEETIKTQPGSHQVPLATGRTVELVSPKLSLAQAQALLQPFLDPDVIGARRSEYRTVSSGLGPLEDALTRAGLTRAELDLCLLVGGSVDLPGLPEAIEAFLPGARLLRYDPRRDPDGARRAIARGAALHALSLAVAGHGLVQPMCGDTLALRTQQGSVVLVKQGTRLPFPDAGCHIIHDLEVPQSSEEDPVSMRVEIVAGEDEHLVFAETWAISAPVSQGEPLLAEIRMDENQVLELRLRRTEVSRSRPFEGQIENPLTNVINSTEQELEAEKIEADFAAHRIPAEDQRASALRLSQLFDELGQHEKAMEWLRKLQARSGRADAGILNRMAILAETIGDSDRARRLYREAARVDRHWTGPLFNLALMQRNHGELDQAQQTIGEVLTRRASGPDLILAADIAKRQRREHEYKELLERGLARMGSPEVLDDFELSWLSFAARLAQDAKLQGTAEEERIRRGSAQPEDSKGELPIRTLRSAA